MGLLEFGTSFGLAATFDHNAHAAHQLELLKMERALRLDQENRVKLQADEFKMPEQMNEYDSPRAQQIAEQKFKEASAYELSNPDYAINVTKKRIRDKILYDAVNNQYTYRGMRFKDAEKKMTDFLANNPGAIRNPEIQKQLDEIKAYKTHQGPSDPSEYVFRSPDDEKKMYDELVNAAKNAKMHGVQDYKDGYGSARRFVTDADRDDVVKGFLDSPYGDAWVRAYNNDKNKGNQDINTWLKERMNPHFDEKIDPGKFLKGMTDANGNVIGGVPEQGLIPYHEMLQKAIAQPNTDILAPVEAIDKLYRNNNGTYDMSKSYLLHQDTGDIKKTDRIPINLDSTKNAVSTGIVRFIPDASNPGGGVYMTKYIVKVPGQIADREMGRIKNEALPDVIDSSSPWNWSRRIDPDYDGYGLNLSTDENGKEVVSMEVWKPLDPSNQAMANTFNAALGGTKSEAVSSAPQQLQQQQIQPMAIGTQYTDSATNEVFTLQADGNWRTVDGKIYGQ